MPVPPKAKTGYDYSTVKQTLNSSDLQKRDNNTFQSIRALIEGAEKFQGFVDNQFPQLDGSTSSLLNAVREIQEELLDRQNTKYDISLSNIVPQSIPGTVETVITFDTEILNDGLLWDSAAPDEVKINHHAYWQFYGWVTFCLPIKAYVKIIVKVNGEPQIHSAISTPGKVILPFVGGFETLRNDIVQLFVYHTASINVDVIAHLQGHRVSWVVNQIVNASGRRNTAAIIADDEVCDDLTGTDDCICILPGIQYGVLPQSKHVYFFDKDAKFVSQTPAPTDKSSTFIFLRNGNVLVAIDDVASGFTKLQEFDISGALLATQTTTILMGQGSGFASHSLLELPCKMLLTVNRNTGDITEYDVSINGISRILGLNIDPFDGAINQVGNRLVYVDGNWLKVWDTASDEAMAGIKDFGFPIIWPTWLSDCSVIVFTGTYLSNGDFRIVTTDGIDVDTITYDSSRFPNGLLGYAINLALDALWIVGLDSLNRPGTLMIEVSTGNEIGFESFNFAPTVINETAMVGAVYQPVKCTITEE